MSKKRKESPAVGMLSTCTSESNLFSAFFKLILVVILLFCVFFNCIAQGSRLVALNHYAVMKPTPTYTPEGSNLKIGFGLNSQVSRNGHGNIYIPYLKFSWKKSILNLGLCTPKSVMCPRGVNVNFSYNITSLNYYKNQEVTKINNINDDQDNRLSLLVFSYVQYLHRSNLGQLAQKVEDRAKISDQTNYHHLKLSTAELGLGITVKFRVFKNCYLRNYIGTCFSYHTEYSSGLYRERMNQGLILGTGIDIVSLK